MNLQLGWKRQGKLADPVIEKWRTYFKRVGHTHPVHFGQNVVGQVILEVESEMPVEVGAPACEVEQFSQRPVFRFEEQLLFLILGECSVPKDVRFVRMHQ